MIPDNEHFSPFHLEYWEARDNVDPLPSVREWLTKLVTQGHQLATYLWPSTFDQHTANGLGHAATLICVADHRACELFVDRLTSPSLWTLLVDAPGIQGLLLAYYKRVDSDVPLDQLLGLSADELSGLFRAAEAGAIVAMISHDADMIVSVKPYRDS
jgi:hypothetical protein